MLWADLDLLILPIWDVRYVESCIDLLLLPRRLRAKGTESRIKDITRWTFCRVHVLIFSCLLQSINLCQIRLMVNQPLISLLKNFDRVILRTREQTAVRIASNAVFYWHHLRIIISWSGLLTLLDMWTCVLLGVCLHKHVDIVSLRHGNHWQVLEQGWLSLYLVLGHCISFALPDLFYFFLVGHYLLSLGDESKAFSLESWLAGQRWHDLKLVACSCGQYSLLSELRRVVIVV